MFNEARLAVGTGTGRIELKKKWSTRLNNSSLTCAPHGSRVVTACVFVFKRRKSPGDFGGRSSRKIFYIFVSVLDCSMLLN